MAKEVLLGTFGLGLAMLVVFIGFSMQSLSYNQVGINYSQFFKSIENKTYSAGFHFLGLGHQFVPYQIDLQTIEFSHVKGATLPPIECRTKDGLHLQLEVSFQYRVQKDFIYEIYTTFGDQMRTVLLRMAIDTISETSTDYSSSNFFSKKQEISEVMQAELNERLKRDVRVEVVFFQLRSIDLPDEFELALQNTEVTKQDILKAQAEREKNNVTQQMLIDVAMISRNITLNQAIGKAQSKVLKVDAQAETFLNIQESQAKAYAELTKNLTFKNEELIDYIQLQLVKNYPEGNLIIALKEDGSRPNRAESG